MLTRLYVDNYKSLINFELTLNGLTLLTGKNGTGKTCVLEVLHALRAFAAERQAISDLLKGDTRTRWETRGVQTFELELATEGHRFEYRLRVEHTSNFPARVLEERLLSDGQPLFEARLAEDSLYQAQLFRDDHSRGPMVLSDWTRSGVAQLQERPDNRKLVAFRNRLQRLLIVTVDPWAMKPETEREDPDLAWDMRNFASWYRHVHQERPKQMEPFYADLRAVIDGFEDLPVRQAGETTRVLRLETRVAGRPCPLAWRELSEGQRVLIGLYALLHWAIGRDRTLIVDEPENFVALPEIQPWLTALFDKVTEEGAQVLLISHHPEVKDYLAVEHGLVFERQDGPTRVRKWPESDTGLRPSELSARGWEVE